MAVHVKICGVTSVEDALMCIDLGASAIGLNFVPASPRAIDVKLAREIADAVKDRALVVGVVCDLSVDQMRVLKESASLGCLQLHGDEPDADLKELLPHAYKAVRIANESDVARARAHSGAHLLVDAKVEGMHGGTGKQVDLALVAPLAKERKLTLAGGLRPDNVACAIQVVAPYCVDVASGVELRGAPRKKDEALVHAFIHAAKNA